MKSYIKTYHDIVILFSDYITPKIKKSSSKELRQVEICILILGEMGICGVDFQATNIDITIFDLFSSNLGNLSKYAAIALGGICIVNHLFLFI